MPTWFWECGETEWFLSTCSPTPVRGCAEGEKSDVWSNLRFHIQFSIQFNKYWVLYGGGSGKSFRNTVIGNWLCSEENYVYSEKGQKNKRHYFKKANIFCLSYMERVHINDWVEKGKCLKFCGIKRNIKYHTETWQTILKDNQNVAEQKAERQKYRELFTLFMGGGWGPSIASLYLLNEDLIAS